MMDTMDNQKCILVDFVNEEKIATGYESWLSKRDQKDIDDIINDKIHIIISWPECEITSSTKVMEKMLKKANITKYAVRILKKGSEYKISLCLSAIRYVRVRSCVNRDT